MERECDALPLSVKRGGINCSAIGIYQGRAASMRPSERDIKR